MEFNLKNYPEIKESCERKQEIELEAPKEITAFVNSDAPIEWTLFAPASLPLFEYADVFAFSGIDTRGALTRFELLVHFKGGQILYKKISSDVVGLKVTWPNKG